MKTPRFLSLITLAALLAACAGAGAATASGPEQPGKAAAPGKEEPGIEVMLSFSAGEFDPNDTDSSVECVVANHTDQTILVPNYYDERRVALVCTSHRHPLRLLFRPSLQQVPESVEARAGERRTVFRLPLWLILHGRNPADAARSARRPLWDWKARMVPPSTPLDLDDGGLVDAAVFHAEVTIGEAAITSNEVVLRVKR